MPRRYSFLMMSLLLLVGCGPTAQEKYDNAVKELDQAQSKLDNLLPAYDLARQTAANAVCKEIAGTTPEESASAALQGLGDVLNQSTVGQGAVGADAGKKSVDGKKPAGDKKGDELDKTIDNLIAGQKDALDKQAALTAPVAKANEVMTKIKTPGTPEAKRFEEKLASMREAKAYERQQKRVEQAQKDVDDAKSALPK